MDHHRMRGLQTAPLRCGARTGRSGAPGAVSTERAPLLRSPAASPQRLTRTERAACARLQLQGSAAPEPNPVGEASAQRQTLCRLYCELTVSAWVGKRQ